VTTFTTEDIPDLTSRTVIITGSNSGIGRAAADALAAAGARVVLAVRYIAWRAYGQSKLANLLFTAELQRRLSAAGSAVLATAAHPGYAATNLQFHSQHRSLDLLSHVGNRLLAQDERGGALPTLYAAVADVPGNSFAGPGGFLEQRGAPKLVGRSQAAKDPDVARRLWEVSEQLTGVSFPLRTAAAA